MILLASSLAREAEAFTALFSSRQWASQTARSVVECRRLATANPPRIAILRNLLLDGYSDDVLKFIADQLPPDSCRIVVLAPANFTPRDECRQLELGADHVLRDPVRVEVLLQLVSEYRKRHRAINHHGPSGSPCYEFCGVSVYPAEHRLVHGLKDIRTTPKVIELVQLLHHNTRKLVSYNELYEVLFLRRFTGETANCRVLLAKADDVFRQLGVSLRACVQVVPKTGYLYDPDRGTTSHTESQKAVSD